MPDGVEGSESRSARDLQLNHGQLGRPTSLEKEAKTLKHRGIQDKSKASWKTQWQPVETLPAVSKEEARPPG